MFLNRAFDLLVILREDKQPKTPSVETGEYYRDYRANIFIVGEKTFTYRNSEIKSFTDIGLSFPVKGVYNAR